MKGQPGLVTDNMRVSHYDESKYTEDYGTQRYLNMSKQEKNIRAGQIGDMYSDPAMLAASKVPAHVNHIDVYSTRDGVTGKSHVPTTNYNQSNIPMDQFMTSQYNRNSII